MDDDELSEHIVSRREVERILTDSPALVVVLRAAVILGSGSTSFEIIRQVSERLPVHTVPTWMDSMVQPIAVVEAMKMENILRAEKSATVKVTPVAAGESLAVDQVIVEFE